MSGDPTPPAPCPGTDPYNLNTALLLAWWVTREYLQKPTINGLAIATALMIMIAAWPLGAGAATLLAYTGLAAFYLCVGAGVAAVHLVPRASSEDIRPVSNSPHSVSVSQKSGTVVSTFLRGGAE